MTRLMMFVLGGGPYSGQTAASVLKLAGAILDAGHRATIFATADGVSGFIRSSRATLDRLLGRGARCLVLGGDLAYAGSSRVPPFR